MLTSFVGRRAEVSAVRRQMAESRLVTLVGTGGVGKTRLAERVAWQSRRAFRDGVWMVGLAGVTDASRLAQVVLYALNVRDQSGREPVAKLLDHLGARQSLLVLDNCEHLLGACAELATALLRAAPELRILATSREPLGVSGEHTWVVPPLSTPDLAHASPPEALAQYEAVSLLLDRARAVWPDFAITDANHEAIAALCARLDGIPLAIELAATRLRSLSVAQIVERLDDRFRLLTGGDRTALPRQQTLRAMIDWSYELCTSAERALWTRLSVFPAGFDLAAAEAVCAGDGLSRETIVDLVDRLVVKSIVVAEHADERVRYRMLVTIREYGAEQLADSGEDVRLRIGRRHRDHYLARARAMLESWTGPRQAESLTRMRAEHANVLAALEWSLRVPGEARVAASLAAALRYHWVVGGYLNDGQQWLGRILDVVDERAPECGEALWVAAWVSLVHGLHVTADGYLDRCAALADDLDDEVLAAHANNMLGLAAQFRGELHVAIPLLEHAVDVFDRHRHTDNVLTVAFQLAFCYTHAGRLGPARAICDKATRLSDGCGERWSRAYIRLNMGKIALREGDLRAAERDVREGLALAREFTDGIAMALAIGALAQITVERSAFAPAARLFGAARAVWREIGTSVRAFGPHLSAESAHCAAAIKDALGAARFDELVAETASLGIERAMAVALDETVTTAVREDESPLTPREHEIAGLIAEGMSNRAVAKALVISPRTVDGHVEHIFAKLGFSSRAQVASWVAERRAHPPG